MDLSEESKELIAKIITILAVLYSLSTTVKECINILVIF